MNVFRFRNHNAEFVFVRSFHRATECHEKFHHHGDVGDVWDVSKAVLATGQEAGRHLLQNGVLGAIGLDLSREGPRWLNNKRTHPSSIAAKSPGYGPVV